jgi:hypothetical protein
MCDRDDIIHDSACSIAGLLPVGAPDGRWVHEAGRDIVVTKILVLWQKRFQIVIFWYFIVLPPYPLLKTYDGWVQREG